MPVHACHVRNVPGEHIASIRKEYTRAELSERSVLKNPFNQFEKWFQEAVDSGIEEPTAMVLSTVNGDGQLYQRTVLLKTFNEQGFVFYTNYNSRKASHLNENPKVSLLFPWYALERQVAITGTVEKVSAKESLKYFLSRPTGSQLGAWVSNQSEVITIDYPQDQAFEFGRNEVFTAQKNYRSKTSKTRKSL